MQKRLAGPWERVGRVFAVFVQVPYHEQQCAADVIRHAVGAEAEPGFVGDRDGVWAGGKAGRVGVPNFGHDDLLAVDPARGVFVGVPRLRVARAVNIRHRRDADQRGYTQQHGLVGIGWKSGMVLINGLFDQGKAVCALHRGSSGANVGPHQIVVGAQVFVAQVHAHQFQRNRQLDPGRDDLVGLVCLVVCHVLM